MKKRIIKGFTLMELLAAILILSLVVSFSAYVIINIIDNVRENGYKTNINNVEKYASSYLVDNSNRLFYLAKNSDVEYQCITVQNLIDMGYFDEDVDGVKISKDVKISKEHYIYVERQIDNKTIIRNDLIVKYALDDSDKYDEYSSICGEAVTALGDIRFDVQSEDDWTLIKDVKVSYILNNLNDYNKLDEYTYKLDNNSYVWTDTSESLVNEKIITVDSNRIITASIYNNGEDIVNGEKGITKIDREGPKISLVNNVEKYVSKTVTIPVKVTDFGIGADLTSFTNEDLIVTIGGKSVIITDNVSCNSDGECNIVINNTSYNGSVVIKINAGSLSDKLGNKNKEIILNSTVKFDNSGPVITLGTDGNSTYSKIASSKITVSDDGIGGDTTTYKYIYSTSSSATPCTGFKSGSSYSKDGVTGDYYLVVNACDKLSNCTTKVSKVFKLDNTGPVITINGNLTKIYGQSFDLFDGVTITDNVGTVDSKKVYLGSTEVTSYSGLSVGVNTVTYKAKDNLGNESSKTRTITLGVSEKEFPYKEYEQSYEIEAAGTYIIEAYGAQGGNSGGKGGYVKAEVYLTAGTTIYIKTGGTNGYNGGGGYSVSGYYPGGGATTVKYNGTNIVIAAGGGATGPSGSGGAGGSGNGSGGSDVGSGAGKNGSTGGGGSSSPSYDYDCNCGTCGGGCAKYEWYCAGTIQQDDECHGGLAQRCIQYYNTWQCNCSTCTTKGKSGTGGSNKVTSPASSVSSSSGSRSGNGYAKISYKIG